MTDTKRTNHRVLSERPVPLPGSVPIPEKRLAWEVLFLGGKKVLHPVRICDDEPVRSDD